MSARNPFLLFRQWYLEALDSGIPDPSVMTLATAGRDGSPSARIVLLKEFDEKGFVFYTNYRSRKAEQLEQNPRGALVMHWQDTGHQVRIEGRVERTSGEESDGYFATRPRGSQLGAWASEQSRPIASRENLEDSVRRKEIEFMDREVPRPPHWGGYRLIPERIEFWTEREDRLHERIVYERAPVTGSGGHEPGHPGRPGSGIDNGGWVSRLLAP